MLTDAELRESLRACSAVVTNLRASCVRANVEARLFGSAEPLRLPAGASFLVHQRLGAGGMGVVYEVEPAGSGERLALKVLFRAGGDATFRLKREFRTLARLTHQNLVVLHELFADERGAAFTMELVRGDDFVTHVQAEGRLDDVRLRAALAQLADGLAYLHATGIVHRDIKSNNVLVTAQGRVVLLDFGIAADGPDTEIAGTSRFMPEEQRLGRAVAASDMYAVGGMLELCLHDAQGMRLSGPLDPWLELCAELRAGDPARRPSAAQLLERLEAGRARGLRGPPQPELIGRQLEQDSVLAAFRAGRTRPELLLIRGDSGIGKTALLEALLRRMRACEPTALVLEARCSHREFVPYRALDPLVDGLSTMLSGSWAPLLAADGVRALLELFPALRRAPGLREHTRAAAHIADPRERRRAAVQCLRELLRVLGREHRLVFCIDDAQRIDEDSLALLEELLAEPNAPCLLLIATAREACELSTLGGLFERVSMLELTPLSAADTLQLARRLLPEARALWPRAVELSRGDPLMLTELGEYARKRGGLGDAASFETLLRHRLDGLAEPALSVLQLVSLAREPLALELLSSALERDAWDVRRTLQQLESERYLRLTPEASLVSEPYHERVRRLVQGELSAEAARALHRRLARALEAADAQRHASNLFYHCREAEEFARAVGFARNAAAQAGERLAFLEAAELYGSAATVAPQADDRDSLREAQAAMLASAGRDRQAAQILALLARDCVVGERRAELRRSTVALFYRSGADPEGHAQLLPWLDELSIPRPSGPSFRHLALFMYYRLRTKIAYPRPHAVQPRDGGALARARIDACLAVTRWWGMGRIDVGLHYQARSLYWALGSGTATQLAYAFLHGAVRHALEPSAARSERALSRAAELCERSGDRQLRAQLALTRAQCGLIRMEFRRALHDSRVALTELDAGAHSMSDRVLARGMWFTSRFVLGDAALVSELKATLADAGVRGDVMLQTDLRTNLAEQHLLAGDDAACLAALRPPRVSDARPRPRSRGGPVDGRAWARWVVLVKRDLYLGRTQAALRRSRRMLPALRKHGLLRVPVIRVTSRQLAALVLAAACGSEAVARIARIRRTLARERFPYAKALALQLEGTEFALRGDRARAIQLLTAASFALEAVGDTWQAWASASLADELAGRASELEARLHELRSRGVVEPRRYLSIYAPPLRKETA